MAAKAKSFKGLDPVTMFTSAQEENLTPALNENAPEISVSKIIKRERETKSRRVNALVPEALFEKLKRASLETGVSMNDIINQALEQILS